MTEVISFTDNDLVPELEDIMGFVTDIQTELINFPNFVKSNTTVLINKKMSAVIALVNKLNEVLCDVNSIMVERLQKLTLDYGLSYDLSKYNDDIKNDGTTGIPGPLESMEVAKQELPLQRIDKLIMVIDDASKFAFRITTMNMFSQKLEIHNKKIDDYVISCEFTLLSILTKMYPAIQMIRDDLKNVNLPKIIEIMKQNTSAQSPVQPPIPCFSERKNNGIRMYDITEYNPYYGDAFYN